MMLHACMDMNGRALGYDWMDHGIGKERKGGRGLHTNIMNE
jgi:hypothetical protein